jgi:hypothetical protein
MIAPRRFYVRGAHMPWTDTGKLLSTKEKVQIDKQEGLEIAGYQPFAIWLDTNANAQMRIQNADGKIVFYPQSAISAGLPSVVFNSLTGDPPPAAIEVHAQEGLHIVGYQPFITLDDGNAGYAQSRIQGADGKIVFYVQSAINARMPSVIFNSLGGEPPPPAIEVHAQDAFHAVGYQPFITLDDADSGYALARMQNARGELAFFTAGAMAANRASLVLHNDGSADIVGPLNVAKDIVLTGGDCAEQFEKAANVDLDPGTVVVLDEKGGVRESDAAYDKKVAGVVSGAGRYKPGIVLNGNADTNEAATVALVGRVYCKVDADCAPIETGDLLTTSHTRGHAMKAVDGARAFGSVLGKALGSMTSGRGILPVLVVLQ